MNQLQQPETSLIAAMPPAQRAMIALNSSSTEEKLREMVLESAEIQEVKDKAGREQAHTAGMKLKNTRIAIEKTGKAARDDANAFGKAVIDEEKRLKAIIEDEEKRVLGLRDAYDAKIAAEKAEAERIERERIASIKVKIEGLRRIPLDLTGQPAAALADELQALQEYQPSAEDFAEFLDEAKAALSAAIESITAMHQRQAAVEDEQARLAAERERLEQERQAREAEEARLRAEREALEAERRLLEEQRAALAAQQAQAAPQEVQPVAEHVAESATAIVIEQPADGLHQIAEPSIIAEDQVAAVIRESLEIISEIKTIEEPTVYSGIKIVEPSVIADIPSEVQKDAVVSRVVVRDPGFAIIQPDTAEGLLREFVALMDSTGDFHYEFDEMDKLEDIAARARAILT